MHNPLESYRRTQREIRHVFDSFTRSNCSECPTPCCRQPARIQPVDIVLARSIGWKGTIIPLSPIHSASPPSNQEDEDERISLPCEYLGEKGCTFPSDLHPLGCTTFICKYMYQKLDRRTLTRIKRLSRDLEEKHAILERQFKSSRA